jgi:hypothetical protein
MACRRMDGLMGGWVELSGDWELVFGVMCYGVQGSEI